MFFSLILLFLQRKAREVKFSPWNSYLSDHEYVLRCVNLSFEISHFERSSFTFLLCMRNTCWVRQRIGDEDWRQTNRRVELSFVIFYSCHSGMKNLMNIQWKKVLEAKYVYVLAWVSLKQTSAASKLIFVAKYSSIVCEFLIDSGWHVGIHIERILNFVTGCTNCSLDVIYDDKLWKFGKKKTTETTVVILLTFMYSLSCS